MPYSQLKGKCGLVPVGFQVVLYLGLSQGTSFHFDLVSGWKVTSSSVVQSVPLGTDRLSAFCHVTETCNLSSVALSWRFPTCEIRKAGIPSSQHSSVTVTGGAACEHFPGGAESAGREISVASAHDPSPERQTEVELALNPDLRLML